MYYYAEFCPLGVQFNEGHKLYRFGNMASRNAWVRTDTHTRIAVYRDEARRRWPLAFVDTEDLSRYVNTVPAIRAWVDVWDMDEVQVWDWS